MMPEPEIHRFSVVQLTAEQTHPLRLVVLRADTPGNEVSFIEDTWPGALHLGVRDNADRELRLVATSSWIPRSFESDPSRQAVQLRGMATLQQLQGTGIGGLLLRAGLRRAHDSGASLVWANARDVALDFYRRHGFTVIGDGFVDATTQLPHHVVLMEF